MISRGDKQNNSDIRGMCCCTWRWSYCSTWHETINKGRPRHHLFPYRSESHTIANATVPCRGLRFTSEKVKEKKRERLGIWDGDCQECKDTSLVGTNQPRVSFCVHRYYNKAIVQMMRSWPSYKQMTIPLRSRRETRKRVKYDISTTCDEFISVILFVIYSQ